MAPSNQVFYRGDCEICREIAEKLLARTYCTLQCLQHDRPHFVNQPITLFEKPSEDINLEEFKTLDSGERQEFSTGMKRDVQTDKPRYDLIWTPGLRRLAQLMGRGSEKYGDRNWEKARTQEELDRFKASAFRHFMQWFAGERDEDHMAGCIFNLFGAEYVKGRLNDADSTINGG